LRQKTKGLASYPGSSPLTGVREKEPGYEATKGWSSDMCLLYCTVHVQMRATHSMRSKKLTIKKVKNFS